MPLILTKNENGLFRYGIWHHIEADEFFLQRLKLSNAEEAEVQNLKARKKSEWLCSRYLLTIVADHEIRGACLKDEYGKPYIEGSDENISISHTFDYTAVIISKKLCGIDIQVVVPKIIAIGPRFINENELKYIPKTINSTIFMSYGVRKKPCINVMVKKSWISRSISKSVRLILARFVSHL